MIRNLNVSVSNNIKIKKVEIHNLVQLLKLELNFSISSLVINFVTSDEIIPINNKYLGHNFSTDIITFNYSGENYTLDGEIFISLDDASYNAQKYEVELNNEILRLVIHGLLHLIGYDDKDQKDKRKMKSLENTLVNKFHNSLTKIC